MGEPAHGSGSLSAPTPIAPGSSWTAPRAESNAGAATPPAEIAIACAGRAQRTKLRSHLALLRSFSQNPLPRGCHPESPRFWRGEGSAFRCVTTLPQRCQQNQARQFPARALLERLPEQQAVAVLRPVIKRFVQLESRRCQFFHQDFLGYSMPAAIARHALHRVRFRQ